MEQMEKTMKKEGEVVEASASSAAHRDTKTDSNFLKPDTGLLQSVKTELSFTNDALVKKEILEDASQDDRVPDQSAPVVTGGANEACGTSLGDLFNVKYESAEMDIETTVLQHMDIHYTINKHNMSAAMEGNTTVYESNGAMQSSGGRKGSFEDKWRDNKTTSHICAQTTEMDYGLVVNMKSLMEPHVRIEKEDLQKLLYRFRTTSSNGLKCDRTFRKPHLQSAPDKLRRRNSRRAVTTRGPVTGPSNQSGDIRIKTTQNSFACDLFGKEFSSKASSNLDKSSHCSVKLKNRLIKYKSCSRKTRYTCVEIHTGEKPFQCETCDAKFAHKSQLTRHMKIHTGEKPFQCETCDAKFTEKSSLIKHTRVHTGEKPFQCEICDAKFAHKIQLTRHMMKVLTGEMPFQCKTCYAKFALSGYLTMHMRVHTGLKPFQCETCNKKFTQKGYLIRHMRVHTGEKPFQCETCEKKFTEKFSLTKHLRVHTREKPFQCQMCDAKFAHKGQLTRHMKVHTGEKPFQCETCDVKFTEKSSLTMHMRVHTGEKPFQCETCDAKFSLRSNLTTHMRVHTGEKPFQCETCYAKFARSSHLTMHMRVHTCEKPFHCETCDAKFSLRSNLTKHMRVHTGEKPVSNV